MKAITYKQRHTIALHSETSGIGIAALLPDIFVYNCCETQISPSLWSVSYTFKIVVIVVNMNLHVLTKAWTEALTEA